MTSSLNINSQNKIELHGYLYLSSEMNKKSSILLRDAKDDSMLRFQVAENAHQRRFIHISVFIHGPASL